jgi:hypothetical protein
MLSVGGGYYMFFLIEDIKGGALYVVCNDSDSFGRMRTSYFAGKSEVSFVN